MHASIAQYNPVTCWEYRGRPQGVDWGQFQTWIPKHSNCQRNEKWANSWTFSIVKKNKKFFMPNFHFLADTVLYNSNIKLRFGSCKVRSKSTSTATICTLNDYGSAVWMLALLTIDRSKLLLVCPGQDLFVQSLSIFELALLQVACSLRRSNISDLLLICLNWQNL